MADSTARDGVSTVSKEKQSMLKQPMAVWAVAGASVFAFMGIGLVDPILPAIAENLSATPSQVSLLFTSYFLVTAIAMLVTGFVSSRLGGKRTLLLGLGIIVIFATLSGLSGSVDALVGFRAGWGLGNALFVATALAVMVGVASGGAATAIILYEAALGLGLSLGPLMGAMLGAWQWRAPFFGTATAMAVAFILLMVLLPKTPLPATKTRLRDPLLALGHKGLRTTAGSALFYNYGFFTILAFVPFILGFDAYGIGAVFFSWGVAVAVFSVFVAPMVQRRFGPVRALTGSLLGLVVILAGLALAAGHSVPAIVVLTVVSGALLGINNTLFTEMAMAVSDSPRPVASAGYNFVRWMGGALAPFLAAKIAEYSGASTTFFVAAAMVLVSAAIIVGGRKFLTAHAPAGV
ncbi:MFS transporter [Arthrobacter psychrochitiniphilus]|uniref:MFS transporter n=1 Tax=Arthrobacter psychrochitiniphilus TaxID=291045 RepID=A0A2V3DRH6_9MICC|nr:MFS transporter [Arthrobacter psychrochitiniphilus]NYG18357.1 putative MFS family arabinose efflux permease [Arthrobacter psychrochitiniphilus]PXA64866.1 MFS transporter [Arthrobacter psychrochitiniphilus]